MKPRCSLPSLPPEARLCFLYVPPGTPNPSGKPSKTTAQRLLLGGARHLLLPQGLTEEATSTPEVLSRSRGSLSVSCPKRPTSSQF